MNDKPNGQGKAGRRFDPRNRTKEYIQFDVLEGPCTRLFHRFVERRMISMTNPKPYPFFIGGVQRLCRMLDVADPWELIVLGAAPFLFALGLNQRSLGMPAGLGGFTLALLACYGGYWFVLLVFLDRRLDHMDLARVKQVRFERIEGRNDRLTRRRRATKLTEEMKGRVAEAQARGQEKAKAADTKPAPPQIFDPAPAPISDPLPLDQLLDKG